MTSKKTSFLGLESGLGDHRGAHRNRQRGLPPLARLLPGAADLIRKIFRDRESPALPLAGHVEPPQALGVDAGHLMSDLRRQQGQRLTP